MNRRDQTTFTTSTAAALESRATATRRDELHKCTRSSDRTVTKTTTPTTTKSSMKLSPLRRRPKRDPFTPAPVEKEEERRRTRKHTTVVSFADDAQVIAVASLGEVAEDANEIWWSESEIDKISTKAHAIAQKLQWGTSCVRRYCARGLEDFLHREQVDEAQSAAWEAVLKAQGEQRQRLNRGDANDAAAASEQAISMAYMRTSWGSKMAATKRAIRDEEEIRNYTKDTRRTISRKLRL